MRTQSSLLLLGLGCYVVSGFTLPQNGQYNTCTVSPMISNPGERENIRTPRQKSTWLRAILWDRLEIEEDPEPYWYLLNCIAGLEIDLLRQARERCRDMPDVVKFVVPTEKKTRSHGANRMVTETKVKYQGYVFAKLRLCPEAYEAIQQLDLCRSWMGTVNHKGYKKLPPAPVALNELEVENFGLEEYEDAEEEETETGDDDVIVDTEENEAVQKDAVDQEALKVYLGLKVEDMVKVTNKGKFDNEDGIVRRLKEGRILVRFFTYGSMFEEWMDPGGVRKLTNEEVLRGLSGPSQPITQQDFDDPADRDSNNWPRDRRSTRNELMSNVNGARGPRNRRHDRVGRGDTSKRDIFGRTEQERHREERNWKWYQERQQSKDGRTTGQVDKDWNFRAGSGSEGWAAGDVDSQWGRGPSQRQQRRERRAQGSQHTKRMENAMEGKDDWSAFVSPAASPSSSQDEDAFFASLMSDLSDDLEPQKTKNQPSGNAQLQNDDDFFASLMSELSEDEDSSKGGSRVNDAAAKEEDDFFASLEAELGTAFDDNGIGGDSSVGDDNTDDFFDKLQAEMSTDLPVVGEQASVGTQKVAEAPKKSKKPKKSARSASAKATEEDFGKLTVPVLKGMLRERGLKVSGKKNELIERLQKQS